MAIRTLLGQVRSCCRLETLWDETTGLVWEPGSLLNMMNKQMLFIKEVSTSDLESGCALFLASLPIYVDSCWLCTMIFCDDTPLCFCLKCDTPLIDTPRCSTPSLILHGVLTYLLLVIYTMSVNPAILMSSPSRVSISDTSGSHHSFYPESQLDFARVRLVQFYGT